LSGISVYDNFTSFEKFKKEKFYYPVLTLNTEIGQRFAFNPFDDLMEDDYQTIDAYTFSKGYYQIMQQFSKTSKIKLNYSFNKKEYDDTRILNNKSDTYTGSVAYKLLPDLTANIGIKYREKKYDFDNTKLDILFEVYNKIFDVNYDVNNGIYNYDATNTSLVFLSNTYVIPVDLAKFVYDIVSYYMATYSLSVSDAMSKIITDEVSNIYSMKQDLEMKSAELMKVYISLSAYITPTA